MATIERKTLMHAMKSVMPGIDRSGFKENTDSFLFSDGILATCNTIVAVSIPLDVEGMSFAVRATEIYALVNKSNGDTVELTLEGNKLRYKCGKLRSSLVLSDPEPLRKVVSSVSVGEFKPLPSNFGEALLSTRLPSYSVDKYKGVAIGNMDGKNVMLAFDGDAFAMHELNGDMEPLFVDDTLVANSLALGTAEAYSIDRSWFTIRYDSGAQFSCKVNNILDYPLEQLSIFIVKFMSSAGTEVSLPEGFSDAVERVSVMAFAKNTDGIISNSVRIGFCGEGVEVYAEKDARGDAEEIVPWGDVKQPEGMDGAKFFVSSQFIVDAVKKGGTFRMVRPNPNGRKIVLIVSVGQLTYFVCCVAAVN